MKGQVEILNKLDIALELLESEGENVLVKAEKGIKITKTVLEQLRDLVVNQHFKKSSIEINFFKILSHKFTVNLYIM